MANSVGPPYLAGFKGTRTMTLSRLLLAASFTCLVAGCIPPEPSDGDPPDSPAAPNDDDSAADDDDSGGVGDDDDSTGNDPSVDDDGDGLSELDGDCDDENADVFPGQTATFGVPRADGSYDYDCDGTEVVQELGFRDPTCVLETCNSRLGGWVEDGGFVPPGLCPSCVPVGLLPGCGEWGW